MKNYPLKKVRINAGRHIIQDYSTAPGQPHLCKADREWLCNIKEPE